jgi:hypothetical protein
VSKSFCSFLSIQCFHNCCRRPFDQAGDFEI